MKLVRLVIVVLLFGATTTSFGQEKEEAVKVWGTIDSDPFIPIQEHGIWKEGDVHLREVFNAFDVKSCAKALPDSRSEKLQRVYEVEAVGSFEDFSRSLSVLGYCSQIDPAPEYELLSVDPFPDDYSFTFSNDYALNLINAEIAWEYSTGDPNTVIGVVAGGFYLNHEELQGNVVAAQNPIYASPYYYMHGTAVSIAAAGNTNNAIGKSSIGYNCQLSLKSLGYNEMLQLCYQGVRVINVSWTSGCFYTGYYDLIMNELFENGCIVVAAAGNGGQCGGPTGVLYPAGLDGVISVSSVGPWDNHERIPGDPNSTHQHNAQVDICAPGYDVAGTNFPGNYLTGSGSSFAAPYVTGAIGLMLSLRPCLSREEVISVLKQTAVDIYPINSSDYDGLLGAGRLDAGAALQYLSTYQCAEPPLTVDGNVVLISMNNPRPQGNTNPVGVYSNQSSGVLGNMELEAANVNLFPNPSKGQFTVRWEGIHPQEIQITDATGKQVFSQLQSAGLNSAELILCQTGVYFLKLIEEGRIVANKKVVIY
ncbi:S8 family serine peptidase [Crocinitomicaceae bacterium]|nr:S8 family serine peptidase [Crocinitomicaceae bacterium]